eukprot:2744171-Pleurochrysis_carterae.AAC.1
MHPARTRNVDRCMALPAARRRNFCACALCACTASSGARLCPPLDVGSLICACALWACAASSGAW